MHAEHIGLPAYPHQREPGPQIWAACRTDDDDDVPEKLSLHFIMQTRRDTTETATQPQIINVLDRRHKHLPTQR